MRDESMDFFRRLVEAPGPSGDERLPARVWREYVSSFAEPVHDRLGSSFAVANVGGTPSLAVLGHVDEIGLVVNDIDDDGFVWFGPVGGWDPEVLVGQRVRILTRSGSVPGVVGKKSRHHQESEEREKASKVKNLWIDIGATGGDDARNRVHVGDLAVLEQPLVELANNRIATRAADNRCGAFVAAEVVRLAAEKPEGARVTGVATVSEETTFTGAFTTAFAIAPDVGIAVDVTNATDYPTTSRHEHGHVQLGKGPSLSRGAGIHPLVFEGLVETAGAEGIPYQVEPSRGETGTDLDAVHLTREGVPGAVVSIPLRYMHSPNEQLDPADLEACAALIAAYARRLTKPPSAS
jgi:putative aminopeptidase FrvX